jgi:hypothetical protein
MSERFMPMDRTTMPCLFCGNTEAQEMAFMKQEFPHDINNWTMSTLFRVSCSCGAEGPNGTTKEEAVDKWNDGFDKWFDRARGN